MTHAEVDCLVARTRFRVVANGVGGQTLVIDAAPCGIQIGALGQCVGVAESDLAGIIVCASTVILADVGRDKGMAAKRNCCADKIVAAFCRAG